MSDGDVSLIRDEDLLRRMWQQTEDFSRKKEIRAHMYRLREERLRNLYSPEPKHEGKGSEFTAAQDHVKSFADQSFQSMKSKEVRDAGSPPKEFTYRGQDLKALSNAGWNVEQENKTTDDGRTHVKSINANIEGSYDVDGGKGQFAAVDHHKEAVTEYHDDNSSLKRNETSSNTAAREHVVQQTDDGTHVTSTTSSSSSSSKIQKMSSTRHESVPYVNNDDYDLQSYDTNRNEDGSSVTRRKIIKTNDYEQNLRNNEYEQTSRNDYEQTLRKNDYEQSVRKNDYETGELVSRKVDYPDDNTRVIVETRCLPDGTRVTSTKREFRAPVQSTRAEQSYQTRSENRSYSTQQRSNTRDSSKVTQHVIDNLDSRSTNIVDSQRNVDDYDFKRQIADYSTNDTDDYSNTQYERKVNKRVVDNSKTDDSYDTVQRVTKINKTVTDDDQSNIHRNVTKINKTTVDHSNIDNDYSNVQRYQTTVNRKTTDSSKIDDNYSKLQHHETNVNQRMLDHSKTDDDYKQTTQHVTRTHKIIESTDNDEYAHREINKRRYNTNDDRPEKIITPGNPNIQPKDYKDVQPKDRQPERSQPESYQPRRSQPRDTSPVEAYPRDSRPRDTQPKYSEPKNTESKYIDEKIHNITRDDKVETIERKISTEERKTTYQTDYSQKKISNDWSPSHTAWASTLRGDTPSTTRPSTRASSPGSKTFRSSTSSLRSSVSPDKTYRKPLSRGSSPNKIDRPSPTRSVSDQHYTTHSTHSITETKSHKYMTPDERRPPTGRHPSGSGHSPERKPQDHRQMPSASPEKKPQSLVQRNSVSPDRKPTYRSTDSRPHTDSPIQPVDRRYSPTRPQESPEKKFPQHIPSVSGYPSSPNRSSISPEKTPIDRHPKDIITRPNQSPDRKPGNWKPSDRITGDQQTTTPSHPIDATKKPDHPSSPTTEKHSRDNTPNRKSTSPDRKPGYMMPTASRQPSDTRKPPAKPADQHSPTKHASSPSPTRKPQDYTTTQHKKYHEDHYKFIDEETKMYTRTDKTQIDDTKRVLKGPESPTPREKSSSPTRKSPSKDTDVTRKLPGRRSPSPQQHVTNIEKLDQVDTTIKTTDVTDCVTTTCRTPKDTKSPSQNTSPKEPSPSKFGTYDKKKPSTETTEAITKNKSPSPTRKSPNKDIDVTKKVPGRRSPSPGDHVRNTEKHDRIDTTIKTTEVITKPGYPRDTDSPSDKTTPREKSPSKFGTYDKKRPHTETEDDKLTHAKSPKNTPAHSVSPTRKTPQSLPSPTRNAPERSTSPTKKTPRDSVSPVKSPTKSTKYAHTTELLTSERTTEEVNKKMTKEHPRQLVTPSSSPTRKPKRPNDTEPSTGQSSPTTSVSGFVYFSSPQTEKTIITDLDEHEFTETHTLDKTTTTSKRPENLEVMRSPSPSKIPCRSPSPERPPKDSLPRKSSLKKPGNYATQMSPVEKPPTSFLISPTEPKEFPGHKTVKKDRPDESTSKSPLKSKPPLERRETYEDRCRKILGMTEDTSETVTTQPTYLTEPVTNLSSPSISPCRSPAPKDTPFTYPTTKKDTSSKIDVTDFITHEQDHIIKSTGPQKAKPGDKLPKSVRDSSPTKLQDIITVEKTTEESDTRTTSTTKYSRQSSQRKPSHQTRETPERDSPERYQKPKDIEYVPSISPAKLHPGSSPRSSSSPDRKVEPKENSPVKKPIAKASYNETTTTVLSKYDSDKDTEEITVTTKTTDRKPSRLSDLPTRKSPGETIKKPTHPTNEILRRKSEKPKEPECDQPKESSPTKFINLETTISMVAEYGSTEDLVESVEEATKTRVRPTQPSKSPTRKSSTISDSSPTWPSHPSKKITDMPNRKQPPKTSPEKKLGDKPKDSFPTRPGYIKTTTSITSKHETTTEDLEEPSLTEPHSLKPEHSSVRTSPSKKPGNKYPEDSSPTYEKPKKLPGYMKVTESVSSKYDTISSEHDEKSTTLKTERYHPSEPMESPTRKASKPKLDVTEQDTDLEPGQNPSPHDTQRYPEDKRPKDTSPHRPNTEKTPHYMTPISTHRHTHEIETTTEDEAVQRKFANYTERHPEDNRSKDTSPNRSNTEKTPHYMTPISSHQHTHEVETTTEEEHVQRKFANYTERHPDGKRSKDTSPNRSNTEKTPHYMTPISSHQHTHEVETTTEEEHVQRKFASYTERHPEGKRSKDTSPNRSNTEKTPHYMTPISTHRHTHEIETTIEDEEVQRKFANYTERHPEGKRSKDTSPNRSNTEKTPHYMTPISTHRHTHEIETTIEDEEVQRKFANYTERHPEGKRSKDTSPHRPNTEKTPHYMTPISSHQHTHEVETTTEEEHVQRKFANYTERHPEGKRSKDTSPNRSNTEKTPHYMTPISTHRHTHEIETTIEDEEVQRKFANYTERHPEGKRSKDTSPNRSNTEKTPHYMTPISTHRHTHEIETTIEDEEVQRKFANYTERHPEGKRSKDTSPNRSNTEKTPHYMTPISTHRHTHEIETTIEDEEVQRKFANYTERHPEDKRSEYTSPHRPNTEKTPHYMTPISSHQHTHEVETTTEEERVQRKFANYSEGNPEGKRSKDTSPNRSNTEKTPHYMTPISTHRHTHEIETTIEDEEVQRKFANYTERHPEGKRSKDTSPNRSNTEKTPHYMTPISTHRHTHVIETTTEDVHVKRTSVDYTVPQRSRSPTHQSITKETPHYMKPVSSHLHKHDTVHTKDDIETCTSTVVEEKTSTIGNKTQRSDNPYTTSPTRAHLKDRISTHQNKPSHKDDSPSRKPITGSRPGKTPEYMRPTSLVTSKHETISTEEIDVTEFKDKRYSPRSSVSPSRIRSPDESSTKRPGYLREPEKPRQLRTPSPSKATVEVKEISTDFLMSEREQEILDRVHKSLRKLSPERKEKSPSRERSPGKTTTSLQDIDINTTTTRDETISELVMRSTKKDTAKTDIPRSGKPKEETPKGQNAPSKPSSRNASPTKKPSGITSPAKIDRGLDSTTKPRSISPKKPLSPTEQPPSPTVPKASGIKPKEQIPSHLTRKPTPASLAITKVEKTTDLKRTTGANITTKQNSFTKTTTSKATSKIIPSTTARPTEPRTLTPKGIRESGIPKKDIDTKVTRTVSEITIKSKKTSPTSPQRMKSKPEIQVSDLSNSKTPSKPQKSSLKEPQIRIPGKPKSATALNTPSDEDDIIIDVQQSKSSRENSPDRICPTPVNFVDDTETPRYPDEVKEPDDEFRRRTYHTIHETETIVDDIVEICEDDELFVRKADTENLSEEDESLLSVTDKVTKFTKAIDTKKPKDTTDLFKDTERRVHSDFVKDSDECLLSVSEKVNKFAKGPRDIKDKSPARRVIDEYDKNTVYTDDYTKLSVHDKAHLFVETAENVKTPKSKPTPQKVERPDLTNVDEALKSDDCLLSVSDKVHKFVKTAEQFLTENHEVDEKEKKIKEQHDKIMKRIVDDVSDDTDDIQETTVEDLELNSKKAPNRLGSKSQETKLTTTSHSKVKDHSSPNLSKPTERTPTVKITTLRSSEAVKKAKALFENIASTTPKTKDIIHSKTTTKLTDIGVLKKSPKTDSTTVLHPSVEEVSCNIIDTEIEVDVAPMHTKDRPASGTLTRPQHLHPDDKPRASPTRLAVQPPEGRRSKSPMRHTVETTTAIKTTLTKYPSTQRAESPKHHVESDKHEKVPGYLRPTKTSQSKEEPKVVEETEVSSRRGSGKFGVELRRTSVERSTVSSERRRSVEHPCIEDIFDLDLLEQMLEKVVGYEQRRRIRAQIRIARKSNTDHVDHTTRTRTIKQTTITQKDRSPERRHTKSPERAPKTTPHKISSPDRHPKIPHRSIPERSQPKEQEHPILNGHAKEPARVISDKRNRTHSPEKSAPKPALKTKSPIRPASPDKKTRTLSPSKTASLKPKANRFNEYATAYMKKVGLSEADKLKFAESKKKTTEEKLQTETQVQEHKVIEELSTSKHVTERTSSKDIIEVIQTNGSKRSPSPEKRRSPDRKSLSRERLHERTPSPDQKRVIHQTKSEPCKRETIIRTVYEVDKKTPQKQILEEKPSWVTNRSLKKINSETRTFSSKKIEEKPKYRAASPSKVISKPIDVITSSYGPGPLDAEGKPLFGIKALRNGASNYQVKGTVIRQEYHSRNGGEPEGTVSVTAYSTEPEELEQLLRRQGDQPSRIHGLAAITTTKKFGGDTGTTLKEIHGKEERAAIDQFTHSDRKVSDSRVSDTRIEDVTESFTSRQEIVGDSKRIETRKEEIVGDIIRDRTDKTDRMQRRVEKVEKKGERVERRERPDDKKTVRQSSVKSLTEKYIKNANETSKAERTAYPKAGLILRTATMKDSVSSDSSAHAGLARTDSEHSLGSVEDTVVTTEQCEGGVRTVTTTTRSHGHVTRSHQAAEPERTLTEKSFLDSNTKVTGVQDILTRMKNADIVIQEGDTSEDMEARALLNKFLGATVLMAGMQSYVTEKPSGKVVVKQETVRTSSNHGGKVSSSQTRSVQEYDIDQCWDERLLRKLLDESKDYEQRRRLRARIRALMAEQEACASAVTEALAAAGEAREDTNEARGESLLLPLLQGLLGGGGERLLAGLGAAPADVVADVRRSLARLRAALAPPAAHPQARALLALADRLEDALDAADRLDGCRQRRPRRRSRTARHTVGVTRGELDEARRLVDNDQLALPGDRVGSSATSTASVNTTDEAPTPERKQSVDKELSYHEAVPSQQRPNPIAHSVSYEVTPPVNRDAVVVEKRAPTQRKPDFYRHSVADVEPQRPKPQQTWPVQQIAQPPQPVQPPQSQALPRQLQLPQSQPLHQPQPAFPPAPMYPSQPYQPPPYMDRRPSESKSSIAAIANKFDSHARDSSSDRKENLPRRAPIEFQLKEIKREDKHTYMPLPPTYNFAAPPTSQDDSKPLSRFSNNSKRLRMKRANTIDIGRPLAGYRLDSEEDDSPTQPKVPEFRPQTENDRKFVAFMKKNEAAERETAGGVQANWSNRFGNIKHAFESREREDHSRSSSASSARRFWRGADEAAGGPAVARPRKFLSENAVNIIKPPWVSERREPMRANFPRQVQQAPAPTQLPVRAPAPLPSRKPVSTHAPALAAPVQPPVAPVAPPTHPPIPQSPTKPLLVKPFATRPIPVNQFSHAPMSAFKPPTKVASPTTAPANIWSPPSVLNNIMSPTKDISLVFPVNSSPTTALSPTTSDAPWAPAPDVDKPRRVAAIATTKFNRDGTKQHVAPYKASTFHPPPPLTHALPQVPNYSEKIISNQYDLSAPELVRKIDDAKYPAGDSYVPKVDAQRLQIEFYEKQIREKNRREAMTNGHAERKPPALPAYTITDYTPTGNISTFVPLQRTPDIEKARAHKVDYLPDVVTNDTDRQRSGASPLTPRAPISPLSPRATHPRESPRAYQNGDVPYTNGVDDGVTTEHNSVVTRVMRGPVRGSATLTAGVRTRNDDGRRGSAADSLRGALDKLSSPKRDVIAQIERKKRETVKTQVRAPVQTGRSPLPAPAPPHVRPPAIDLGGAPPSPGALVASRESVSSESVASVGSSPLSRSGSWQHIASSPKAPSPRRVVARAKSMHLLAVPKLFEGGIAREEVTEKKRTVEAYFTRSQQQARPAGAGRARRGAQAYSLGRSRTMPAVSELQFLDESNTDDAFEDLVSALEEEEVTVTSSVRRNSSEKTVSSSTTTTKTSKVIESMTRPAPKPVSPFAKFRQLEKQNSTNSPNPASPKSPGSPAPYFKFTEPALQASAATIKERLLQWCRDKTRDYENVKLENFSTSWADGLAFCALLHHFLPDAFDYSRLRADKRRENFTLAFKLADEKAGIYPLLDVDDMVAMRKPDWKCVFTYVQSIHRRFKDE